MKKTILTFTVTAMSISCICNFYASSIDYAPIESTSISKEERTTGEDVEKEYESISAMSDKEFWDYLCEEYDKSKKEGFTDENKLNLTHMPDAYVNKNMKNMKKAECSIYNYKVIIDDFNEKYNLDYHIPTPEEIEKAGGNAEEEYKLLFKMSDKEFWDYLCDLYNTEDVSCNIDLTHIPNALLN